MGNSNGSNKVTIKPSKDGPYIVTGLKSLNNSKGKVESKETIALCRCGKSSNKPFCDGTHVKVNFSSEKSAERTADKQDEYVGTDITIQDNRGICAHSGFCTDGLPSVFKLKVEPWIDPNSGTKEEIGDIISKCPSGALSLLVNKTEGNPDNNAPTIFIAKNGPYVVKGGPSLEVEDMGIRATNDHFTLCRCGGSKNKPFCDGTHWYNKFEDDKN